MALGRFRRRGRRADCRRAAPRREEPPHRHRHADLDTARAEAAVKGRALAEAEAEVAAAAAAETTARASQRERQRAADAARDRHATAEREANRLTAQLSALAEAKVRLASSRDESLAMKREATEATAGAAA